MHMRGSQPAHLKTATLQAAVYADSTHVQQMSTATHLVCRLEPELGLMRWRLIRSAWHGSEGFRVLGFLVSIRDKNLMDKGVGTPADLCII